MAIRYKGADYYYIRDGLMTIIGLVGANGVAVVNYRYDSWGILTGITGSMAGTLGKDNLYRFKGVRSWERYLTLSEEDLLVIQAADVQGIGCDTLVPCGRNVMALHKFFVT